LSERKPFGFPASAVQAGFMLADVKSLICKDLETQFKFWEQPVYYVT
jgi:hypothetical protein